MTHGLLLVCPGKKLLWAWGGVPRFTWTSGQLRQGLFVQGLILSVTKHATGLWLQPMAEVLPGTRKEGTLSGCAVLLSQEICRKEDMACLSLCNKSPVLAWPVLVYLGSSSAWQGGCPCRRSEDHMQENFCRAREAIVLPNVTPSLSQSLAPEIITWGLREVLTYRESEH